MENIEDEKFKEQAQKVVEQLTLVKNEFIKNKEELAVSIRKDIVATELRHILVSNNDFMSLSEAINNYIDSLIKIGD